MNNEISHTRQNWVGSFGSGDGDVAVGKRPHNIYMSDLLLVYITCESVEQARKIGRHLMKKRLCACVNIFPKMHPMFWWPPKQNKIDETIEVVLIAKTIESKYEALEEEVIKIHSYDTPCIIAIPTTHVTKKYYDWLVGELE